MLTLSREGGKIRLAVEEFAIVLEDPRCELLALERSGRVWIEHERAQPLWRLAVVDAPATASALSPSTPRAAPAQARTRRPSSAGRTLNMRPQGALTSR